MWGPTIENGEIPAIASNMKAGILANLWAARTPKVLVGQTISENCLRCAGTGRTAPREGDRLRRLIAATVALTRPIPQRHSL